jgi:cell division protease FtsH
MVRDFGMSRAVGLRSIGSGSDGERTAGGPAGARGSRQVDDEVRRLIDDAHARAVAIIVDHRVHVDRLADRLVAAETLEKDEIDRLLAGVPRQASAAHVEGPQATVALRRREPQRRVLDAARTQISRSR